MFLNSDLCRSQFDRAVIGSSRLALDYPAIRGLRIVYPPDKTEQQRLVDVAMGRLKQATTLLREADAVSKTLSQVLGTT